MLIYLLLPVTPLLIQGLYRKAGSPDNLYHRYLFIAMLPLFLLVGFRAEYIGADTLIYLRHFADTLDTDLTLAVERSRMEAGYIVFVKYVGYITSSPKVFQLIYTTIYFVGYYSFARLLSKETGFVFVYLIITLGIFFFLLTGVRQNIAISICLFSVQFLMKRKFAYTVLLIILAYAFHKSALLFLFAVLIFDRKLTKFSILIYVIGIVLVSTYLVLVQNWANEQFEYSYEIEETGNGGVFLLIVSALTIISWIYYKNEGNNSRLVRFMFNINIFTLFFWLLRLQTRVAERPSYYFLTISCGLYAYAYSYWIHYKRNGAIVSYAIFVVSYALFVYRLLTNYSSIIPYAVI